MAGSGVNLAITTDGGTYNKLQRPDNFLDQSNKPHPPGLPTPTDDPVSATAPKRKHEDQQRGSNATKRTKGDEEIGKNSKKRQSNVVAAQRKSMAEYGMRMALPGLDDEEEDDESARGADDALAYLLSVRSEASAIPGLLVASAESHDPNDDSDDTYQAQYHDGAWFAVDEPLSEGYDGELEEDVADIEPQDGLYRILLKGFYTLRAALVNRKKGSSDDTQMDSVVREGHFSWSAVIDEEYPNFKEIRGMNERKVFLCIDHCTRKIKALDADSITPQLACWSWALLAAVDARTVDSELASKIRELGVEAGLYGEKCSRSSAQSAEERKKSSQSSGDSDADMSISEDEGVEEQSGVGSELEQARARLLAQLGDRLVETPPPASQDSPHIKDDGALDNPAHLSSRVAVDMILTVVGEYFGQKDLLRYRKRW